MPPYDEMVLSGMYFASSKPPNRFCIFVVFSLLDYMRRCIVLLVLYHVIRFEAALRPWQFTIKRVLRIPSTKFLVLPSALYAKQYKRVAEYCTAG